MSDNPLAGKRLAPHIVQAEGESKADYMRRVNAAMTDEERAEMLRRIDEVCADVPGHEPLLPPAARPEGSDGR